MSNSSPLMSLSNIERLELIKWKFDEILIPYAVWKEITVDGKGKKGAGHVQNSTWIKVKSIKNKTSFNLLQNYIDYGEAEAIALALETQADVLLLDDKSARQIAVKLGFKVMGVLGILIWAKNEGLITSLSEEIEKLKKQANFRLSNKLIENVLQRISEK